MTTAQQTVSTLPPPARLPAIAKVCGCCGQHHTWPDWFSLKYVGPQDDGDGGWISLRNCLCGSTIAVENEVAS